MSTALSWTEPHPIEPSPTEPGSPSRPSHRRRSPLAPVIAWISTHLLDPVADLRTLLRFRSSGLGVAGRRRMRVAASVVGLLSLAAIVVPAYLPGAAEYDAGAVAAGKLVAILPSIYLGFLVLAAITAAASGGGREVVPRDQAVTWPISSTTDHFGALLLAPLNIAWLLEAWALLGMTAYVAGPHLLPLVVLPVLVYLLLATALGQVLAWTLEWVRRGPRGVLVTRGVTVAFVGAVAALVVADRITDVLDASPTVRVFVLALGGSTPTWSSYALPLVVLVLLTAAAVLAGAVPAGWAARRAPREEHRLESGIYSPRPEPLSDLRAMVRVDRAGVWRSVPLRRGLIVLALMPGAIAFAGDLPWTKLTILPGLVASGAALLFGVNGWCLDGRGGLWRESLPHDSSLSFASRAYVLTELLLGTAALTLVMAVVRAGAPSSAEAIALLASVVVVTGQVVSASMRWSVRRPFATDMRSARATPAPPVVMVGYSTRLALVTTFVGLVFSGLAVLPVWWPSLLVAVPLVAISAWRIARVRRSWRDPEVRARVVVTVAG